MAQASFGQIGEEQGDGTLLGRRGQYGEKWSACARRVAGLDERTKYLADQGSVDLGFVGQPPEAIARQPQSRSGRGFLDGVRHGLGQRAHVGADTWSKAEWQR